MAAMSKKKNSLERFLGGTTYKDSYEGYETGDWYEIERQPEFIGEYDPDENDNLDMIHRGMYQKIFEQAEAIFERKPTVYDYHDLYLMILDYLQVNIINDNLFFVMCGEKLSITFEDIIGAFQKEQKKLNLVFKDFVEKIETQAD
jgi:fido (protein-threonine AMPylation protein)